MRQPPATLKSCVFTLLISSTAIGCGAPHVETNVEDTQATHQELRRGDAELKREALAEKNQLKPQPSVSLLDSEDVRGQMLQKLNGGQSPDERRAALNTQLMATRNTGTPGQGDGPGWAYEIVDQPENVAMMVGGGIDSYQNPGGTPWLVRYSCCNSMPLFVDPDVPFFANGVVSAGELVRIHDIIPGAGLKSKLAPASSNTILLDLLDPRDELYWARVESPGQGIEGWAPLYAFVMSPLENQNDDVQVDMSYGKLAREANAAWTDVFSPDGCAQSKAQDVMPTSPGDCFYVDEEWGWGQTTYAQTCNDVYPLYNGMKQKAENGDTDCTQVFIGESSEQINDPEAWTTDCAVVFDLMFVEYPESYYVPNTDDYACGEYPFGTTHWDGVPHFNTKKLVGFGLWGRHAELKMDRRSGQKAASFDVQSLSHHGAMATIGADKHITSQKLWFGLNAQEPTAQRPSGFTELKVCAYMPGADFWSPEINFDADDTPGNAVNKIQFGSLAVGQVQGCLVGEIFLDASWQPQVVWTDLDQWWIHQLSVDDMKIIYAPWVYAAAAAAAVVMPALLGNLGTVLAVIIDSALLSTIVLPATVNSFEETWLAQGLVVAGSETFLSAYIMSWLQNVTDQAVNNAMPAFQPMAQAACGAVCPVAFPPGHPMRPFCQACNNFANSNAPFQFVRDPGAEAKGCYDVDSLFTPHGKTVPNSSPWWHDYDGFGWASGDYSDDEGCKLGVEVSGSLEKRSWEFAKCAMWRANTMVNQDMALTGAGLRAQLGTYCNEVGRDMLRLYYGTGQDVKDLLDTNYPQFETTYLNPGSVPEPEDDSFPISAGGQVVVEPPVIQGFTVGVGR